MESPMRAIRGTSEAGATESPGRDGTKGRPAQERSPTYRDRAASSVVIASLEDWELGLPKASAKPCKRISEPMVRRRAQSLRCSGLVGFSCMRCGECRQMATECPSRTRLVIYIRATVDFGQGHPGFASTGPALTTPRLELEPNGRHASEGGECSSLSLGYGDSGKRWGQCGFAAETAR